MTSITRRAYANAICTTSVAYIKISADAISFIKALRMQKMERDINYSFTIAMSYLPFALPPTHDQTMPSIANTHMHLGISILNTQCHGTYLSQEHRYTRATATEH